MKRLYLLATGLLFAACSDFLEVVPKDKQTQEQLFATKGGFYTAANGIYDALATNALYGQKLSYEMIDLLGKRHTVIAANTYFNSLNAYTYGNTPVAAALEGAWSTAYRLALNCNVLIDNIDKQVGLLTAVEADILRGEMLATRALLHLDMLRLFGPIYQDDPSAVSIPYNELSTIAALPLLPADTVIGRVIRDLKAAGGLLAGKDPVIENGPLASEEPGESVNLRYRQLRLNYYAVLALEARACLYAGDKVNALAAAKRVLNDPAVQGHFPPVDPNRLLANQVNPDRVFSTEVLFGIYRKDRATIYTRYFDSENAGNNFLHPHTAFVEGRLFSGETQDYRFQSQWQQATGVGVSGHVFTKFKAIARPDANDPDSEYFYATLMSLIRLQELYYIAAESEPDLADGYAWLNEARARRGVPVQAVVSEADLLTRLRLEYLREFTGEGQAFFLYKRLGSTIASAENGSGTSTVAVVVADRVPPMPVSEIENR
ncbi:MAG: RagB/SusD family nutrient uptake outer membrane protein [Odoribacteraceae bacterium]|nr:RagB/SusD family nutrient uptake outer membrane protein [Odoribacteraceae bacterium]